MKLQSAPVFRHKDIDYITVDTAKTIYESAIQEGYKKVIEFINSEYPDRNKDIRDLVSWLEIKTRENF